jgi:uncharacterized protein (DUF427 family)
MARHVRAEATLNGETIAASDHAIVVDGDHYFPREDVRMDLLEPCATRSLCPLKGIASHFTVHAGDAVDPAAAWAYKYPAPLSHRVKDRVAFRGDVQTRTLNTG